MRKRFSCLLLFLASLASAQYKTNYTGGATDLTGYAKTGTNLWKSLTGQCKLHSAAVGSEGHAWCVGTDSYVYKYTTAWVKQTAMGTAVVSLAVQNDNVIYSLQSSGACSGGNYGIFKWTGSAWTQQTGCLSELSLSTNGFLSGVNSANQLWNSTNGGATWNHWSDGWIYVDMWADAIGCAINTGNTAYEISSSNPAISLGSPGGTLTGCLVLSLDNDAVLAWNSAGSVYYDDDGTWHPITGLVASQIVGRSKGEIFGFGSTGLPFHWNAYAGYIAGATTGSYFNFPMGSLNPPPQHTGRLQTKFPHSLSGVMNTQTIPYNGTMDVTAWDANPFCDLFLGADQPECIPTSSGNETCNHAGLLGTPQQPPHPAISHWYVARNYLYNTWQESPTYTAGDGRWHIVVHVVVSTSCASGSPTCVVFSTLGDGIWDLTERVSSKSLPVAQAVALVLPSTGPWVVISSYLTLPPPLDPAITCVKLEVQAAPNGGICD